MSSSSFARSSAYKRNVCKSLVIKRQLSWVKDKKFEKVSDLFLPNPKSCMHVIKFIQKQTCNQSVKFVLFPRNFSTSIPAWSSQGSNQDKEKRKNYIFFSVTLSVVLFTAYMHFAMESTQDRVFIKLDEKK